MRTYAPRPAAAVRGSGYIGQPAFRTQPVDPTVNTSAGLASAATLRELHPVNRLEWEQILRRARTAGLLAGTGRRNDRGLLTKGGVSPTTFMAVSLCLASYGDYDGSRIFPGAAAIAVDLECGIDVVRKVIAKLAALGLLQQVAGAVRGRGKQWRLTMPSDLLEHIAVLTPDEHRSASKLLAHKRSGQQRYATADDPSPAPWRRGQPQRPMAPSDPIVQEASWTSSGRHRSAPKASSGGLLQPPLDTLTFPGPTPPEDRTHCGVEQSSAVTLRANEDFASCDAGLAVGRAHLRSAPTYTSAWCTQHPGMKAGRRDDGRPRCTFCRRLTPAARSDAPIAAAESGRTRRTGKPPSHQNDPACFNRVRHDDGLARVEAFPAT